MAKPPRKGLITATEYARLRGVTQRAVMKAIEANRITARKVGTFWWVDPEKAEEEWAANTDENQRTDLSPVEKLPDDGRGSKKFPAFSESRAIREAFQARVTKLEYEKKKGLLVSKEEVENHFYDLARFIRDAVLNVPAKIATELAAETEPYKVEKMLERELRQTLEGLSRSKYLRNSEEATA